jgi:hypothetical protein
VRDTSTFFIDKINKFCGYQQQQQQLDRFNRIRHQQQRLQYHGIQHHQGLSTRCSGDKWILTKLLLRGSNSLWHIRITTRIGLSSEMKVKVQCNVKAKQSQL